MAGRVKYTESERNKMWQFVYQELKKRTTAATTPCGLALWEKYIALGRSDRTACNLASHFRKQMSNMAIHSNNLTPEQQIYVCRQLGYTLEKHQISWIENQGYKVEFRSGSRVPIGLKQVAKQASDDFVVEESDSDDDVAEIEEVAEENGSLDEEMDISLDSTGPIASAPSADRPPSGTRGCLPLDATVYDPDVSLVDPSGLNYTRQGREAMAKSHVRHSLGFLIEDTESNRSARLKKRKSWQTAHNEEEEVVVAKRRPARDSFDSPDIDVVVFADNNNQDGQRPGTQGSSAEMQEGQGMLIDDTPAVETAQQPMEVEEPQQVQGPQEGPREPQQPREEPQPPQEQPEDHSEEREAVAPATEMEVEEPVDKIGEFRRRARGLLIKSMTSNIGFCDDDLKILIEKAEDGIFNEAKDKAHYMDLLKAKMKQLVRVAKQLSEEEAKDRPHPSIVTTPTFTLKELETAKIGRNERQKVILETLKGLEDLPTVMMAKLCHFIDCCEHKMALEAEDENDYRQRWNIHKKQLLKSFSEKVSSSG